MIIHTTNNCSNHIIERRGFLIVLPSRGTAMIDACFEIDPNFRNASIAEASQSLDLPNQAMAKMPATRAKKMRRKMGSPSPNPNPNLRL
jgi:hypothetical protein